MKFRPLHDRVVVQRVKEDTKTAGGIIIPDTATEKPSEGKVISVGPGTRNDDGSYTAAHLAPRLVSHYTLPSKFRAWFLGPRY